MIKEPRGAVKERAVIHLTLDEDSTRCGLSVEELETAVSSGTREYVLRTTRNRDEITCKRCIRSVEVAER